MPGGQPEWYRPRSSPSHDWAKDSDKDGHGSCVASKAAGRITGVSKNSRLVIMKSSHWMYDELSAWENILNDIIQKGRGGRSVVVYARSTYPTRYSRTAPLVSLPSEWQQIRLLMEAIVKLDVSIVVSAGNHRTETSGLDTLPSAWLGQFPLVVVGAVTLTGAYTSWTQGIVQSTGADNQVFWAPGDDIECANGPTEPGLRYQSGTSFAAGMVGARV